MSVMLFAHRGGRAHAPDNTLAAFGKALKAGCPGIESDVRLTADGVPVLVHDASVRRRRWGHKVRVSGAQAADMPRGVASLGDLFTQLGTDFELSLDILAPQALLPVVSAATEAGFPLERLWLCGSRAEVAAWHTVTSARLVETTRRKQLGPDLGAAAEAARAAGAVAINLPFRDWVAAGRDGVAAVRAAGVLAFGWDAHSPTTVAALIALGCDAVYGDDVKALLGAVR